MQIAAARGWLGISQAKLAMRTKIALRTIKHFEAGERLPYERTVAALVAYLEKRGVEFLMDGELGIGIKVVGIIEDEEDEQGAPSDSSPESVTDGGRTSGHPGSAT